MIGQLVKFVAWPILLIVAVFIAILSFSPKQLVQAQQQGPLVSILVTTNPALGKGNIMQVRGGTNVQFSLTYEINGAPSNGVASWNVWYACSNPNPSGCSNANPDWTGSGTTADVSYSYPPGFKSTTFVATASSSQGTAITTLNIQEYVLGVSISVSNGSTSGNAPLKPTFQNNAVVSDASDSLTYYYWYNCQRAVANYDSTVAQVVHDCGSSDGSAITNKTQTTVTPPPYTNSGESDFVVGITQNVSGSGLFSTVAFYAIDVASTFSTGCTLDVYYVLDTTGSMSDSWYTVPPTSSDPTPPTEPKIKGAEQAINTIDGTISSNIPGSQVSLLTFSTEYQNGYQLIGGLAPANSPTIPAALNNISAAGATDTATALEAEYSNLPHGDVNNTLGQQYVKQPVATRIPIVILLSDGLPNVDLNGEYYGSAFNNGTSTPTLAIPGQSNQDNANFYTVPVPNPNASVFNGRNGSTIPYQNTSPPANQVVQVNGNDAQPYSDTMSASLLYSDNKVDGKGIPVDTGSGFFSNNELFYNAHSFSIGLETTNGSWNHDLLQYFSNTGSHNTFAPNNTQDLISELQTIVNNACSATMNIQLPPGFQLQGGLSSNINNQQNNLYVPSKLTFGPGSGLSSSDSTNVCAIPQNSNNPCVFNFNYKPPNISTVSSPSGLANLNVQLNKQTGASSPYQSLNMGDYDISVSGLVAGNYISDAATNTFKLASRVTNYLAKLTGTQDAYASGEAGIGDGTPFSLYLQPTTETIAQGIATVIKNRGIYNNTIFLASDSTCANPDTHPNKNSKDGYLCAVTTFTLNSPQITTGQLTNSIEESIPLQSSTITINGNTASGGQQSGFVLQQNAVALGGTFNNVTNGDQISNYTGAATQLNWQQTVGSEIKGDINNAPTDGTTDNINSLTGTVGLNSERNSLSTGVANTFSSPPEGKLWYVGNGLSIGANANSTTIFNGTGTIVVDGNVTINGNISCTGGDFGLIASGSITFNGSTSIGCGAYVAGDSSSGSSNSINFPQISKSATFTGVFIASGNVNLPTLPAGASLNINYDSNIANNPPILFKTVLNIILSSPS